MTTARLHTITAWIIFLVTLSLYLLTIAPTISFWDSAEFVTCARTMGIPHPPGAPLLTLAGRVISLIPLSDFRGGDVDHVAWRINLIAVLSGALSVMLMYLIGVKLMKRVFPFRGTWRHDGIIIFGAGVSALLLALSHQFWDNAVEVETYMPSLFLSMLALWLTMTWEEKKDNPGAVRYLFLASYLIGLGNGIHLSTFLIVPTIVLIVIIAQPGWFASVKLWISCALLLGGLLIIRVALGKGLFTFILLFFACIVPLILLSLSSAIAKGWKHTFLGIILCISLFTIGYSISPTTMVRAQKNPAINEGNPNTWARYADYIERKQYGEQTTLSAIWHRNASLSYQFGFMYLRYLLQQFPIWGPSPKVTFTNDRSADYPGQRIFVRDEVPVSVLLWFLILFGFYRHMRHDPKHWGVYCLYFFLTSVGLVLYLNMKNPEARDRDYFFLGSFASITIWFGFGVQGVTSFIQTFFKRKHFPRGAVVVSAVMVILILTVIPAGVLSRHIDPGYTNYEIYDRSENFISLDYGINILESCEPSAILFTQGDNDTYPLWYAQEVKEIRRDVRVVNLSLLNAPWYIKQLRDDSNSVPIDLSDDFIDRDLCGNTLLAQRTLNWSPEPKSVTIAGLTWDMPPNYIVPATDGSRYGFLTVSSYMTAHIINAVNWTRPIYFSVGVAHQAKIGLDQSLSMEGMVFRLTREKTADKPYHVVTDILEKNLMTTYTYRGINTPDVYKSSETKNMIGNYFAAFVDLCHEYVAEGKSEHAIRVVHHALSVLAPDIDRRIFLYSMLAQGGFEQELHPFIDDELNRLIQDEAKSAHDLGQRFLDTLPGYPSHYLFEKLVARYPHDETIMKGYKATLSQTQKHSEK